MLHLSLGLLAAAVLGAAAQELQQEPADIFFSRIGVTAHELHYAVVRQAFDLQTMEKIAEDLTLAWIAWHGHFNSWGTTESDHYQDTYEWIDDPGSDDEFYLYDFHATLDRIRTGRNRIVAIQNILGTTEEALTNHLVNHGQDALKLSDAARHRHKRDLADYDVAEFIDNMDLRYLDTPYSNTLTHEDQTNLLQRFERALFTTGAIIAAAVTAASISTLAVGTWVAAEIVRTRERAILAEELSIGALLTSHRMGRTQGEMANITIATLEALRVETSTSKAHRRFERALTVYFERLDTIEMALDKALTGRLSSRSFAEFNLGQIADDIRDKAVQSGMAPDAAHISDWLQFEAGFIGLSYGFDVLLHVPLYRPDDRMTIFQYHPLPIPLQDGAHLSVAQNGLTHIAINDAQTLFRAMDLAEFNRCHRRGHLYICDLGTIARKAPEDEDWDIAVKDAEMCLFALFTRRYRLARATCITTIKSTSATLTQVGVNTLGVYLDAITTARVVCRDPALHGHQVLTLHNTTRITVPDTCGLETSTHSFAATDDSFDRGNAEWNTHYQWPANEQLLLRGMNTSDLDSLIAHAATISHESVTTITIDEAIQLARVQHKKEATFTPTSWTAMGLYASAGLIAAALGLAVYAFMQARRRMGRLENQCRADLTVAPSATNSTSDHAPRLRLTHLESEDTKGYRPHPLIHPHQNYQQQLFHFQH
jgi:hypothetical protein